MNDTALTYLGFQLDKLQLAAAQDLLGDPHKARDDLQDDLGTKTLGRVSRRTLLPYLPFLGESADERAESIRLLAGAIRRFIRRTPDPAAITEPLEVLAMIAAWVPMKNATAAAAFLGISFDTLQSRVKEGRITPVKGPRGHLLFTQDSLEALKPTASERKSQSRVVCQCCGQFLPRKLRQEGKGRL